MEDAQPGTTALEDFRKDKDRVFVTDHHSPLPHEARHHFEGLKYYAENPALRLELALEPPEDTSEVRMGTSTGEEQVYHRAGSVAFKVGDQDAHLTLLQAPGSHEYFLPFRDKTSGKETYGAGRYVEVDHAHEGKVLVDFNYAYNPNCAYSPEWSCPLPPPENWLQVPIEAGEKNFSDDPH